MSESSQPLQSLSDRIKNTYKSLELRGEYSESDIKIYSKDTNSEFVEFKSEGNEAEFFFNPSSNSRNTITIAPNYPLTIPQEKRVDGLTDLYKTTFLTWMNRNLNEVSGQSGSPEFFYSGTNAQALNTPFSKDQHTTLVSFQAKARVLNSEEIEKTDRFAAVLDQINEEVAKDAQILGLCQINVSSDKKTRGEKEIFEEGSYILLVVRGRFTKTIKKEDKREFHDEATTRIVTRKIENKKTANEEDKLMSALVSYIATSKALQNPYRG